MQKHDIIKQWKEDQKPINPEALGWIENDYIYSLNEFTLEPTIKDCIFKKNELIFVGRILNQGELRLLMKMLNIK